MMDEQTLNFGYVYLIRPAGHNVYKIGCAKDVKSRMRRLQRGHEYTLECVAKIWHRNYTALETQLHRRFAGYCLNNEWFALPDSAVEFIKGLAK